MAISCINMMDFIINPADIIWYNFPSTKQFADKIIFPVQVKNNGASIDPTHIFYK
jgi:hypothetical protein